MTSGGAARLALVFGCVCVAGAEVAAAQSADDLFDRETLHELRLFIHSSDLQHLRERYGEDTYYPADLYWQHVRVRNVGVRSRGMGSRSAVKPGLKIDFNRYSTRQEFLGLESLVLDNLLQDPALVREYVAMAFFRRLGEPSPRESFARLYINDMYQGLYAIVEPVNADFLSRTLGESTGYLFERTFVMPYYGEDLGPDATAYATVFAPRNHEREPPAMLYSSIRDLFYEVNQPPDTVWRGRVERYLDLEQLVTHVAIETFLSELDGVLGFAGMTNFYLYRRAGTERHRLLVWDKDRTFTQGDSPILLRAEENVLFTRALAFDDLRALYLSVLERCARSAVEGNWLEAEITHASALIQAAAYDDIVKPFSNDEYDLAVAFLKQFARQRPAFVLQEVARARGAH